MAEEKLRLRETLGGFLPVKAAERIYSFRTDVVVQTAFSVATWLFLMGAWVGMAVPFPMGMAASFAGMVMIVVLCALSTRIFTKLGVDQNIGMRALFGPKGSLLALLLAFLMLVGWLSIPLTMFGRTFDTLMTAWGIGGAWSHPAIWAFVALLFSIWVIRKGPERLGLFTKIAIPTILVILVSVVVLLFQKEGASILTAVPPGIFGDTKTDFWFALELQAAGGTAWFVLVGGYAKLAKSEAGSFWSKTVGWGVMWALVGGLGVLIGASMAMLDPVDWLIPIGGMTWGIAWLVMVLLANVTSCACVNYPLAAYLKSVFPKVRWDRAIWISLVVLPFIILPVAYDRFGTFMAITAILLGGIIAVSLVEHIVNWKRGWSIRELYNTGKDSVYYFWKGWNPAAWISIAAGVGFYLWAYNPVAYEIHNAWIFTHGGPTLIMVAFVAVLYFLLRMTPLNRPFVRKQEAIREGRTPYA